ncbi:hypothetical protein JCM8547_009410 [Rhodosporidiobolus lusitaniae]
MLDILQHLLLLPQLSPTFTLASLARVNRTWHALAAPLLYAAPSVVSLAQFDALLATLDNKRNGWAGEVKRFRVDGSSLQKGYGARVGRLSKAVKGLERLEIVGVDDLRMKLLVGTGTLTHFTLLNSSFRPNTSPSPPTLPLFLSSLTSLTLANVGLPPPSTHFTSLLSACSNTLTHLAISSLRDVHAKEFQAALRILSGEGSKLKRLTLGFLTDEQVYALCSTLPSSSSPQPALSLLPLTSLLFTLPLPSLPLLLSLPPTLTHLTIRPPYCRPSSSIPGGNGTSTIFGTDKSSLLSMLDRSRSRSSFARTPAVTPGGSGAATPVRGGRRPSVSIEQLEEEETVLVALEEALAVPRVNLGEKEVEAVVAPRLERIRWEGRAMKCAKSRVREVEKRRREWREATYGAEEREGRW